MIRNHCAVQIAAVVASLLVSGCASSPGGMSLAERDPLEGFNRGMYKLNKGLDKVAVKPATTVYRTITPKAAQRGIRNVFNNVDEPFSFVNALLQGKPKQAARTLGRFLINTILGVGGLADHATEMGLAEEQEDLGQTLAVWGIGSGPFIVLPLLGPSTVRDMTGTGLEFAGADPYRQFRNELKLTQTKDIAVTGVEVLDTRSYVIDTADGLLAGSADEYATVRSAYLQYRRSAIYDGAPPDDTGDPATPTAADVSTGDRPLPDLASGPSRQQQ